MKYICLFFTLVSVLPVAAQETYTCYKLRNAPKNLTRTARLADPRLNEYDINFYFLDLAADNSSTDLEGTVTIHARVDAAELNEFVIELADELTISEIRVGGFSQAFSHSENLVVVTLDNTLTVGESLVVAIDYGGTPPADSGFFSGISRDFAQYNIPVTWTLSEPFNASDWFPVKQVLTDQADSVYIHITVPDHLMAAASGTLMNIVPEDGNKFRFEWETRYPMAYYLISMAIAPYQRIDQQVMIPGNPDPLPIQNFIYDDGRVVADVAQSLEFTPDMILLFSELFGDYPFLKEKYGHAMAPMGGGMEHQTISTMAGFTFTLIAHELMHQWYGDDITCATWQDIWINEGFARYGEYVAIENLISREEADSWMTANYNNVLGAPDGSVFVPESGAGDPYRIFNFRLTYNKGGALLHMLRYVIGNDELFFGGMKAFSENFSGGLASGEDFKDFMESYTLIPLTAFFEEWYYGEGYPVYNMDWNYSGGELTINLAQSASAPEKTPFFSTPLPVVVKTISGESEYRLEPKDNQETFTFSIPEEVVSVQLDPRNIILKKTGSVTSVAPDADTGIQLYPNPASVAVYVQVTSGLSYEATLTDLHGRTVKSRQIHPDAVTRIGLEELPAGMYLLRLQNGQSAWVKQIQVVH